MVSAPIVKLQTKSSVHVVLVMMDCSLLTEGRVTKRVNHNFSYMPQSPGGVQVSFAVAAAPEDGGGEI